MRKRPDPATCTYEQACNWLAWLECLYETMPFSSYLGPIAFWKEHVAQLKNAQ